MNAQAQDEIGVKGKEKGSKKCGVVMPILPIDGLSSEHWKEVLAILQDAIQEAGLEPVLVDTAGEFHLVGKHSPRHASACPVMIFDVSGKNPIVLFELGMRLALNQPTIVIKDEATPCAFDSSSLKPISYPRDLRYSAIMAFKEALKSKITSMASAEDPDIFSAPKQNHPTDKNAPKNESTQKFMLDSIGKLVEEVNSIKTYLQGDSSKHSHTLQGQLALNTFTDIFLRPENLEIFVNSKIDQFVKTTDLRNRTDIEKQRLQGKVFEFIISSNPELDNDVIERLMLEVINRQVKGEASTMVA